MDNKSETSKAEGSAPPAVLELSQAFRAGLQSTHREAEEDLVLETMNAIVGWGSQSANLLPSILNSDATIHMDSATFSISFADEAVRDRVVADLQALASDDFETTR